ncbi:MAG: hypothetical protein DMG40_23165, partial [Acidobacteria bacterium]
MLSMKRWRIVLRFLLLGVGIVSGGCTGVVFPVAPAITAQPTSQTVTAGQTATFTVVAAGTAPLSYQWQKNGTAISGATSASYITPATTSADSSEQFVVVVSNSAGSMTSSAATLTVNAAAAAPSITTQPVNQTVTAGQTATFTVVATGTAPLSYQWQKNGTAISGATSSSYITPATTSADSGEQFVVVVSNTAGSVTSSAATLTVNAAAATPSITTQPANQTVTAGQTATFTVVAAGTAPLSYQWQKNGTAISGATSASYITPATTSADSGEQFVVVVSNSAGSMTSSAATLTVNAAAAAPSITTQPVNQTVTAGQTATFTVVATGTAPLSYQWQKNGTAISGATSSSYTTPATTSADNGAQFAVVVSNTAGSVTSNAATLTVNPAGTMPQFGHVFIVIGETSAYSQTYNSSNMPYLTSLANQYGLATKYWADTHPSIGNYEVFTAGQVFTNDDTQTPSSLPLSSDNIAFEVQQAGKTWKDYVENLPSASGCGGLNSGSYIVRHDPLQYFTNINTQTANFVCFSQFATDLANHALPNLSWLSPNGCDDAHSCSIGTFDNWLQTEVGPLLASSYFQPGGDGLLIVAFEEDNKSGTPNCSTTTVGQGCGGQVETVLISQLSKLAYQSTAGDPANYNNTYDGANILRTIADALRVNTSGLGGASTRLPMADFFTVNAAVGPAVTTQPANQTVTVGQTATFTVVATGTAPLSYQWKKNGAAISGATSASYTTPATTSADNGAQ